MLLVKTCSVIDSTMMLMPLKNKTRVLRTSAGLDQD